MTLEKKCTNKSHQSWEFWRLISLVQVKELEVDILRGDYEHAYKEMVDMATVAADGIRHMGGEFWSTLTDRIVENSEKSGVFDRDEAFYQHKLDVLEREIANLRYNKGQCKEPCMCNNGRVVTPEQKKNIEFSSLSAFPQTGHAFTHVGVPDRVARTINHVFCTSEFPKCDIAGCPGIDITKVETPCPKCGYVHLTKNSACGPYYGRSDVDDIPDR